MKLSELQTPAVLLHTAALYRNLQAYQQACNAHGKQLWPMVKTHKSTALAQLQQQAGAAGFLCGTLDECEALCAAGMKTLMYAYPAAGQVACERAVRLAQQCDFYVRIDTLEGARQLNEAAAAAGVRVQYTVILDCGLHRFGLPAEKILPFVRQLQQFGALEFAGISTHCGHVYAEPDADKVPLYAQQELAAIHRAVDELRGAGFAVRLVTSGATPTFQYTVADDCINVYHPGNYVFNDCIQLANRTAQPQDCALTVYATVISAPAPGLLICDAGAKCLGLDQGAHGNSAVQGHGRVAGHPELLVTSLSEEVGKLRVEGETDVKVGDRIQIIPNHACSSANLTEYYILVDEQDKVGGAVRVDIRGNATCKGLES